MPPGNRRVLVSVPERYVAGTACPERSRRNTRGRPEGRPYYSRSLCSAQFRTASGICDKRVPSFFALAPLRSVPQAGSQFHSRSR
ncbi:MAG: hypothetical protein PVH81_11275, partial [Syntrophobacterales bacterium]